MPSPSCRRLVEDLKAREIAEFDAGAWIVRVARESDKKEMPPIILVNRDGAIGYHGSDLGTIVDRKRTIDPQPVALRRRPAAGVALRAGVPRERAGGLPAGEGAGASRLRHGERAGRQAVQDARGRHPEAARVHRAGGCSGAGADEGSGAGRGCLRGRAGGHRAQGGGRRRSSSPISRTCGRRTTSSISTASSRSRARRGRTCCTRRCASNRWRGGRRRRA